MSEQQVPAHTDFHLSITYPLLFKGNAYFLGNKTQIRPLCFSSLKELLCDADCPSYIYASVSFFPLNKILFGCSVSWEWQNKIKPDGEQSIVVYGLTHSYARKSQRSCKPACLHWAWHRKDWGLAYEHWKSNCSIISTPAFCLYEHLHFSLIICFVISCSHNKVFCDEISIITFVFW